MKKALVVIAFVNLWCVANAQGIYRLAPPLLQIEPALFQDSALVQVAFGIPDAQLMVEIDGEQKQYTDPFYIHRTTRVTARATRAGFQPSTGVSGIALKAGVNKLSWVNMTPGSDKYPDNGQELTDLAGATSSYSDAGWVGYDAAELSFSFCTEAPIACIGVSYLKDMDAWILAPSAISLRGWVNDQLVYDETLSMQNLEPQQVEKDFELFPGIEPVTKEGHKILWEMVLTPALLPAQHPGAGKRAWVFLDEILVY